MLTAGGKKKRDKLNVKQFPKISTDAEYGSLNRIFAEFGVQSYLDIGRILFS